MTGEGDRPDQGGRVGPRTGLGGARGEFDRVDVQTFEPAQQPSCVGVRLFCGDVLVEHDAEVQL
jgi:hypothetical protein